MEFLLFLLFYILTHSFLALSSYYYKLFSNSDRDSFERAEILDLPRIIPRQIVSVFEANGNLQYGILVFFGMSFFSFLWILLGGLFGTAHYMDEFPAYLFHSFLLPAIILFGMPFAKDTVIGAFGKIHPLGKVFEQELPALGGVSVTLVASSLASYGFYHEMLFIVIFINALIISGLFIYKSKQIQSELQHNYEEDDYSSYYSEDKNDLDFDEETKY